MLNLKYKVVENEKTTYGNLQSNMHVYIDNNHFNV